MDDDNMSQVSWSAASESDRMLFTVLSNTERLDVERLPRLNGASSPRVEELPTVVEEEEQRVSQSNHEDMTADAIVREMEMNPPQRSFQMDDYTPIIDTAHDRSHDHHSETAVPPTRFEQRTEGENDEAPDRGRHYEDHRHERRDESYGGHEESRSHEANPYEENRRHETEDRREEGGGEQCDTTVQEAPRRGPEYEREQMLEKQSTLYDLNQLEARGVRLSRKWSMDDSLDDMTHELRHHLLVLDERENVGMMKNGLKMALTGIEIINTRFNLLDLEGWSTQAASELDRQDGNLSRIYRKYWRRSTSNNPESEILFSLFSSMGMYHMKRSMARQMMNRNTRPSDRRRRARPMDDDSSEDEMPPN